MRGRPRRRGRRAAAARVAALVVALPLVLSVALAWGARGVTELDPPRAAPGFDLPGLDGRMHGLEEFRGRYLLVNFWAVWCAPCRQEMPSMERAYGRLRGPDFEMLAIHVGPTLEGARQYAKELGLSFPILVDEDMALTSWAVRGLPTTFLVDPAGRIVMEAVGERVWDSPELLARLRGLMGQDER